MMRSGFLKTDAEPDAHPSLADALAAHMGRYPLMQAQDAVKLIHQSVAGAGHFVNDSAKCLARIRDECANLTCCSVFPPEGIEPIGGGMVRVHLGALERLSIAQEAVNRLFVYGANHSAGGMDTLCEAVARLWPEGGAAAALPPSFEGEALREALCVLQAQGCVPHSDAYKAAYKPAYRVMSAFHARLLPLVSRIDALMKQKGRVTVAIDGKCCAGKSTLAALLAELYSGAAIIPMDDFFLPAELRTKERLDAPGGNIHYERFLNEVIPGIQRGGEIRYRPFDCSAMALAEEKIAARGDLLIIEGSYSLHPVLRAQYDIKVFLDVSTSCQLLRLHIRETERMRKRFLEEWIPMENRYFAAMGVKEAADCVINDTTPV